MVKLFAFHVQKNKGKLKSNTENTENLRPNGWLNLRNDRERGINHCEGSAGRHS